MMRSALYSIVESSEEQLTIRDENGPRSVTSDAENVVRKLHLTQNLGTRTLLYYDSQGQLDELMHDGQGNFLGFAPGPQPGPMRSSK